MSHDAFQSVRESNRSAYAPRRQEAPPVQEIYPTVGDSKIGARGGRMLNSGMSPMSPMFTPQIQTMQQPVQHSVSGPITVKECLNEIRKRLHLEDYDQFDLVQLQTELIEEKVGKNTASKERVCVGLNTIVEFNTTEDELNNAEESTTWAFDRNILIMLAARVIAKNMKMAGELSWESIDKVIQFAQNVRVLVKGGVYKHGKTEHPFSVSVDVEGVGLPFASAAFTPGLIVSSSSEPVKQNIAFGSEERWKNLSQQVSSFIPFHENSIEEMTFSSGDNDNINVRTDTPLHEYLIDRSESLGLKKESLVNPQLTIGNKVKVPKSAVEKAWSQAHSIYRSLPVKDNITAVVRRTKRVREQRDDEQRVREMQQLSGRRNVTEVLLHIELCLVIN